MLKEFSRPFFRCFTRVNPCSSLGPLQEKVVFLFLFLGCSLAAALSVCIRVHPRPKKFGVCRGALLRARAEFGVKGDKALFLTLGNFRHFRHFEF
jgi:hypothetical protein